MAVAFSSAYWKQLLGIDLRSLALFRVVLAIAVILEVLYLLPNADAFLSDVGLFSRKAAIERGEHSHYFWSLYYVNGSVVWAYILLGVQLCAGLALLLGYRSRAAVILCWVLHCSFSTRTISIGSNMYLGDLLFWAMFLPLDARFSIDAALSRKPKGENTYLSPATLAIMLQVAYLYFFGALNKTGSMWQESHDAIYYVLNTPQFTTPLAVYLAPRVQTAHFLTLFVYYAELYAIVFLFSPFRTAWCRLLIVAVLTVMHIGFMLLMSISTFSLVSICGLMVFIPGVFWSWLLPRFNSRPARTAITLYYDADCSFCRKICLIFRELGLPPETRIEPAQGQPEMYAIMQRENSWVVRDGTGHCRVRWDAVAWCWRRSVLLWPMGMLFALRFMRLPGDMIYGFIARHRGALGRLSSRFLPEHDKTLAFRPHIITRWVLIALIVMTPFWCILNIPHRPIKRLPEGVFRLMQLLGLEQKWTMYAANPPVLSHWVVIEGKLADGHLVDVWHNAPQPPSHDEPANGYAMYPDHQWMKYFNDYYGGQFNNIAVQETAGQYFCGRWNDSHSFDDVISQITLTIYSRRTAPPFANPVEVQKDVAFTYSCSK